MGGAMNASRAITLLIIPRLLMPVALAGPPFVTDDPEPTDYRHFEIYAFAQGSSSHSDTDSSFGIDFNYGATPDLQLTAVVPYEVETPSGGATATGFSNVELAAKYRFLHQESAGWDAAVFPRLFVPSASAEVGERHISMLLPLWVQRSWGDWSTFGGGGCALNRSRDTQDYCLLGWALTRHLLPNLLIGAEIVHQGADAKGGRAATGMGGGGVYDLNDHLHLMAYFGPGLQNTSQTARYTWYASVLFTF